jgi:hypothetical protein
MTEVTGIFDGIQATGCINPLTVESLGPLGGVWIVAVPTGILPYAVCSIKVIATSWIICFIIHERVHAPDGWRNGMRALNPTGLIMAEKADYLLAGMLLGILKPVGPQKLGVVHLMGIVARGTLNRVKGIGIVSTIAPHGTDSVGECRVFTQLMRGAFQLGAWPYQLFISSRQGIIVNK